MNEGLPMYKAFMPGRPWVLGIQNQVVSYCGIGICDPLLQNNTNALAPFIYTHVLFSWSMVATGEQLANLPGDDLEIETQQTRLAFQAGIGDTISGGWWTMTASDTGLFRNGAPTTRGFMFLATGLVVNALDPFQRGGTGTSSADPKLYSAWLQESEDGPGYSFLIQKFHINYTAIQVTFGDSGCSYRLGVAAMWPVWGHPAGAQTVRNGLVCSPGMYLPFTTAMCLGDADSAKALSMSLTTGQSGRIQNNAAQPTDLPNRLDGASSTNADGTVYAPLFIAFVGYLVCVPIENYCGIPMLTPDEVIAVRGRLGLAPIGAAVVGAPVAGMIPVPG